MMVATSVISICLLALSLNEMTVNAMYQRSGKCEEKSCEYEYLLTGDIHDQRGKEEGVTSITFTLRCESNGLYNEIEAKKYCIIIKKANVEMFEAETTTKTKKEGADVTKMMSQKYFCFIRDKQGKVLNVLHPHDENMDVVNLKKTIASAFQANFQKTGARMESDSNSKHISHYIYSQDGDKTIEHRYVHSEDVQMYAGNENKNGISVESEEDIEVDKNNVIQSSHGESTTSLSKKDDLEEDEDAGAKQDIPPIETRSTYTLKLKECLNSAATYYEYVSEQDSDQVTDSLMARFNEREHDQFEMEDLYMKLPDLQNVAQRVARSTDKNEKIKITNSQLKKWKRILHLESKHGALGGRKPKIFSLKKILEQSLQPTMSASEDIKHLRLMLYSLLNNEGSLISQKALLDALRIVQTEDERNNILLSIALLESPHSSTVSSFKEYVLSDRGNEQLLLTYATLGRHANTEEEVLNSILFNMAESSTAATNNSENMLYYIHVLGNTGSTLMIPHIASFLASENEVVKHATIDAFRTISTDDLVQELFTDIIDSDPSLDTLFAIVDSLNFPYKSFVYYPDIVEAKGNDIEEELIKKLANATIKADDTDLNKQTRKYLRNIGTDTALELINRLSSTFNKIKRHTITKRAQTSQWNSREALYNIVNSFSARSNDVTNYPYHKAYLWARQFGPEKVHMKLGAGGFGGVGATGFKIYAKGAIDLYVYGRTFEVLRAEFTNRYHLVSGAYSKKFVKINGITYLNEEKGVALPHEKMWTRNLYSQRVFRLEYKIWVWVGFLTFYIEGNVNVDASLAVTFHTQKVEGNTEIGPTFTVTGGTSLTLLVIYQVGLEIDASIGYFVTPKASVTLCDNAPRGDLTGCFGVFHGSKGIDVDITAYYRNRECSWRLKCTWGDRNDLPLFSSTYTLGKLNQQLLWGKCTACDCQGPIHGYCAKANGLQPKATGCSCRLANYA